MVCPLGEIMAVADDLADIIAEIPIATSGKSILIEISGRVNEVLRDK
jgi:hypothetical protein